MKRIIISPNLLLLLILISFLTSCIGNFEQCTFELKENTISPKLDLDTENLKELKNIDNSSNKQELVYDSKLKKYKLVEK